MTRHAPTISVILPLYRHADRMDPLVARLAATGLEDPFELIAIDDASPDDVGAALTTACRRHKISLTLRQHPVNRGQHASVLAGLRTADTDICVVMDADLQDPPEIIPSMLRLLTMESRDVVFAQRRRVGPITSRLVKHLSSAILGTPHHPGIGMHFALNRTSRERLLAMDINRPWIPAMLCSRGLSIGLCPANRERRQGDSGYTLKRRLALGVQALRVSWACRRSAGDHS